MAWILGGAGFERRSPSPLSGAHIVARASWANLDAKTLFKRARKIKDRAEILDGIGGLFLQMAFGNGVVHDVSEIQGFGHTPMAKHGGSEQTPTLQREIPKPPAQILARYVAIQTAWAADLLDRRGHRRIEAPAAKKLFEILRPEPAMDHLLRQEPMGRRHRPVDAIHRDGQPLPNEHRRTRGITGNRGFRIVANDFEFGFHGGGRPGDREEELRLPSVHP